MSCVFERRSLDEAPDNAHWVLDDHLSQFASKKKRWWRTQDLIRETYLARENDEAPRGRQDRLLAICFGGAFARAGERPVRS